MAKRRNSFTLFEIMITCALITMALCVIGIEVPRAIQKARFEKAVEEVIAKASLAQELMMNHKIDVILSLKQEEALSVQIIPQKPIAEKLKKYLEHPTKIKNIQEISFNGEKKEKWELVFEGSALAKTPRGILTLSYKDSSVSLALKGYPSRIQKGEILENEETPPYPEEILSSL